MLIGIMQDKIVTLSNTSAALDAEAHEARAAKNRLQQEKLKVEQQMEVLESHNKWLEEELASKIEAAQQERRTISAHVSLLIVCPTNSVICTRIWTVPSKEISALLSSCIAVA